MHRKLNFVLFYYHNAEAVNKAPVTTTLPTSEGALAPPPLMQIRFPYDALVYLSRSRCRFLPI